MVRDWTDSDELPGNAAVPSKVNGERVGSQWMVEVAKKATTLTRYEAARPFLTLRTLSHDEAVDAFAPTLEEFVEALRGCEPGEFVEAVVVEPLTADDVRQRLEQAAERLGWRLTWAHRALPPSG